MGRAREWSEVKAAAALRDRIAAALQAADEDWISYTDPYPDMADAVIAELGLRPEWGSLDDDFGGILYDDRDEVTTGPKERVYSRYITGWVAEG